MALSRGSGGTIHESACCHGLNDEPAPGFDEKLPGALGRRDNQHGIKGVALRAEGMPEQVVEGSWGAVGCPGRLRRGTD